jgi:DinB superfamily
MLSFFIVNGPVLVSLSIGVFSLRKIVETPPRSPKAPQQLAGSSCVFNLGSMVNFGTHALHREQEIAMVHTQWKWKLTFTLLALWVVRVPGARAQAAPSEPPKTLPHEPTAAELSHNETVGTALMRTFGGQEFEFRSAAEAMPEDKYGFRPAMPARPIEPAAFGPTDLRTFADQVKHVACSNFAFAAELDGKTPPPNCEQGGPNPAKTRTELLTYLRNSFAAMNNSLNAVTSKNMYDPIEGPYGGPNTRLGLAGLAIWHVADHYGQVVIYLRLNGIVPPASRATPPELKDYPAH